MNTNPRITGELRTILNLFELELEYEPDFAKINLRRKKKQSAS